MRHLATLAVGCAVLALAGAASGAEGDPYLKSCISSSGIPPCTALTPPFAAFDVELESERGHLYVAVGDPGGGFNGVRLFDIGAGGSLTPRAGAAFASTHTPEDLDLSPDGRNLYLAAESQLVVLRRDPATGELAEVQSISGSAPFDSVAVSPDSTSVYGRGPNLLTVFDRDPGTGILAQKPGAAGCLTEETALACAAARGIAGTSVETMVSPDGRHVYTASGNPGGVAVFSRAANGTLTQPAAGGCVTVGGTSGSAGGAECTTGPSTLAQALAANVDREGAFVFVSANGGQTVFRREAASGTLTPTDCLDEPGGAPPTDECREVAGAAGSDAAVTPDGISVVLNAQNLGISFFVFDRRAGRLAERSTGRCISVSAAPPCTQAPGLMGGAGGVAVSPNGLAVFAAFRGGAVASIERDIAPRCVERRLTIRRRAPVWVPLACTDANGDEVTLAIAGPPIRGTLDALDQARDRVRYTPGRTHRGPDMFVYRGVARGSRGVGASVFLNVVAAPAKTDRKPPNTRITAGPPKTTRSRTVKFRFRSTERGSEFQCKPDWRERWASCRSPKSYARLRPGPHSFRVRAIDPAGNVDRTPAKRTWRISR